MDRVLKLLDPSLPAPSSGKGYLDLLGDGPSRDSIAQRLMNSTALPLIYERLWRPAFLGLAKGPTGPTTAQEMAMLRDMLALAPGSVVLDVACGPGNVARALATHVGDSGLVVGLDASATMLSRAVAETTRFLYADRLEYVRADAVTLPFRPGSFDAVSCFAALYLFDRPFDALDSMVRALKPGGHLAIMTTRRLPAAGPLNDAFAQLSGVRMFTDTELTQALSARGLTEIRQRTTGFIQFLSARHA